MLHREDSASSRKLEDTKRNICNIRNLFQKVDLVVGSDNFAELGKYGLFLEGVLACGELRGFANKLPLRGPKLARNAH
jgi:hypothetical protein